MLTNGKSSFIMNLVDKKQHIKKWGGDKMKTANLKLKSKIIEKFGSQKEFANKFGVSQQFLSSVLYGKRFLDSKQIKQITDLLEIPHEQIYEIFFY